MGYGLVDAYAAMQFVLCSIPVNFTNQTVTANTTVTSCGDINVQNVIVTNDATLTVEIDDFEIDTGSEFEI